VAPPGPQPDHRHGQAQQPRGVADPVEPTEGRPQVVVLDGQAVEAGHSGHELAGSIRCLGDRHAPGGVGLVRGGRFVARLQTLDDELSDGL
jgi:hypothetical protein